MTLAISRGSSGISNAGELTFGSCLALNNSVINAGQAVTVLMAFSNFTGINKIIYDDASLQYIVSIDNIYAANIGIPGFQFNPTSAFYMYILTSNTAISLPLSLASAVNGMFVPPGFLASDNSTFYLRCNAPAPSLNFVINNLTFLINAVDLKRHASQSLCISSVTADVDSHYVLGGLFPRNVLLAFDFKASNLWLAPRPYMSLEEKQVLVNVYDDLRGETYSVLNSVIMIVSLFRKMFRPTSDSLLSPSSCSSAVAAHQNSHLPTTFQTLSCTLAIQNRS